MNSKIKLWWTKQSEALPPTIGDDFLHNNKTKIQNVYIKDSVITYDISFLSLKQIYLDHCRHCLITIMVVTCSFMLNVLSVRTLQSRSSFCIRASLIDILWTPFCNSICTAVDRSSYVQFSRNVNPLYPHCTIRWSFTSCFEECALLVLSYLDGL